MKQLRDRVAVVTGGASGIGRATAIALARRGMHISLGDIDEQGMQEVAEAVRAMGRRAAALRTDVRRKQDTEALLQHTLRELGGCDVAVNNAGVAHLAPFLETTDDQWQRIIDIDLWGVIHGCRVFGAHFAAQGRGHIVNTASSAGLFGAPGLSAYVAAKFGVVGLSEVIRFELHSQGVGVSVVCPGVVRTNITQAPGFGPAHMAWRSKLGASPKRLARKIVRAIENDQRMVLYGHEAYVFTAIRRLGGFHDIAGKLIAPSVLRLIRG